MLMFEKTFPLVGLALLLVLYLVSPAVAAEGENATETALKCYECQNCQYSSLNLIPCNGKNPTCFKTIHLGSKEENAGCAEFKQPCEVIDRALLTCHCQTSGCNEGLGPTPGCDCADKSIDCYHCDGENECTTPAVKLPCPGIKPACALLQNLETKKIVRRYCTEFTTDCVMVNKTIMTCQCEGDSCNKALPDSCKCGDTGTGPGGNPPPSPGGNPPTPNSAGIEALSPVLGIATALIVAVIQDYHFFLRSTFPN